MSVLPDPVQRRNALSFWIHAAAAAVVSLWLALYTIGTAGEHLQKYPIPTLSDYVTLLSLELLYVTHLVGQHKNTVGTYCELSGIGFVVGVFCKTAWCLTTHTYLGGNPVLEYHYVFSGIYVAVAACPLYCAVAPKSRFAFTKVPFPLD